MEESWAWALGMGHFFYNNFFEKTIHGWQSMPSHPEPKHLENTIYSCKYHIDCARVASHNAQKTYQNSIWQPQNLLKRMFLVKIYFLLFVEKFVTTGRIFTWRPSRVKFTDISFFKNGRVLVWGVEISLRISFSVHKKRWKFVTTASNFTWQPKVCIFL